MLVYLDYRRDINCLLTPDEIDGLESRTLKGTIFSWGNPKEEYPLKISVNKSSGDGILVKRKYDEKSGRLVHLSLEAYRELKDSGLTTDTYFDGTFFGKVRVWDEKKVKKISEMEAMFFGQVKFDLGIRNNSKEK